MYLKFAIAAALLLAGFWAGLRWEQGVHAIELQKQRDAAKELANKADKEGLEHANTLAQLNALQARTRVQVYGLTNGRECLSGRAVRVLNGTAGDVPAAASQPASAAGAFATDRDVGDALAICRGEYAKLSDQLNKILDITDTR